MRPLLILIWTLIPATLQWSELAPRESLRTLYRIILSGNPQYSTSSIALIINNIAIIPDGQKSNFKIGKLSVIDEKNQVVILDPKKYCIHLDVQKVNNDFTVCGVKHELYWCPHCNSKTKKSQTKSAKFIEQSEYKLHFAILIVETGQEIKGYSSTFYVNYDHTLIHVTSKKKLAFDQSNLAPKTVQIVVKLRKCHAIYRTAIDYSISPGSFKLFDRYPTKKCLEPK